VRAPGDLEIETPADEPLIRFRRFVQAPPDLVFRAWTEPEQLKLWWGPADWTWLVCEVDLRVGGGYRFVHRKPDGEKRGMRGEYLEIDPGRKLVNTFVFDGTPDRHSVDTVEFHSVLDGTLVAGTSVHQSIEARDDHVNVGMERGMRETCRRLDAWVTARREGTI
jgi:uncharacterized protein YndB with AHSA1/START domain